jgi:hypothetical protein
MAAAIRVAVVSERAGKLASLGSSQNVFEPGLRAVDSAVLAVLRK